MLTTLKASSLYILFISFFVHLMGYRQVSTSSKLPRLRWTRELHERFVNAVTALGGALRATPKSLMRVMEVPGITLYHLKSHLQKYRLTQRRAKSGDHLIRNRGTDLNSRYWPLVSSDCSSVSNTKKERDGNINNDQSSIRTLLQRNLEEQMVVHRHLQLRIEAQRKYFQSVLLNAQKTIACYTSISMPIQQANGSQVNVDSDCISSFSCGDLSGLGGRRPVKLFHQTNSSTGSSLTFANCTKEHFTVTSHVSSKKEKSETSDAETSGPECWRPVEEDDEDGESQRGFDLNS